MAHTPTPWRQADGLTHAIVADVADDGSWGDPDNVRGYGAPMIAESIRPKNMPFILRACNAHDALVVALACAIVKLGLAENAEVPEPTLLWAVSVAKELPGETKSGAVIETAIRLVGGDA